MHHPKLIFEAFKDQGVTFFTGVPDSLLKDLCAYITDNTSHEDHIIAANEGNAIALAAGHYIGSGNPAVVYMQNSGIGNAINPILSLADTEVYSIPMLLIVGWRGEPGFKDEPQHKKQGRIMTDLLESMEIPFHILSAESSDPQGIVLSALAEMRIKKSPVVLLVKKDSFEKYTLQRNNSNQFDLSREDAIKQIAKTLSEDAYIVSTTGMASRELYECRVNEGDIAGRDFLTVGSMGHSSSIAMGLALANKKRKIICLDGDGSALMHLGALGIIGQSKLENFYHILLNNGSHDSVGGQPTIAHNISLCEIAKACGYQFIDSIENKNYLKSKLLEFIKNPGPAFLEIKVNKGNRKDLGRPQSTPSENLESFMNFMKSDI